MRIADIRQSETGVDRRAAATDLWPRRFLEKRAGADVVLPRRVFWPKTEDEVVAVVQAARAGGHPLVPYGAGSGVCAGISPTTDAWILDTKAMDRLVSVDVDAGECVVEPGMMGEHLERALNAHGVTLGHFPSSIYCSTVGGWVAARSAGQLSSRFGKIEDLVLGLRGVAGTGTTVAADIEDASTGVGALRLLIGSEGALCVFTSIRLAVRPLRTHRFLRGFVFPALEPALVGMRNLMQSGETPCVLRLYDPLDTMVGGGLDPVADAPFRVDEGGISIAGLEHSGPEADEADSLFDRISKTAERVALFQRPSATRSLVGNILARPLLANRMLDRVTGELKLVVGTEGDASGCERRGTAMMQTLERAGGHDAGPEPGVKWLLHRHRVSYKMSRAFAAGGWVDTMEVCCVWSEVARVYAAVRDALRDVAVVMCHFSHAYDQGAALYFTFAGGGTDNAKTRSAQERYDLCWRRALLAVTQCGATVSHHHGVGRSKRDALHRTAGPALLGDRLRAQFDPDQILNPGVLGWGQS